MILDAWADEEAQEPRRKKRRAVSDPPRLPMPALPPERLAELKAQVERQRARAGYKRVG